MHTSRPLVVSVLSAILVPSIVSAMYFAALGGSDLGVPVFLATLVISAGHVLLLGLPAVWLLTRYHRFTVFSVVLVGFLLGCIPTALWSWSLGYPEATVDWGGFVRAVAFMGVFGAIAGLSFGLPYRSFSPNIAVKRDAPQAARPLP